MDSCLSCALSSDDGKRVMGGDFAISPVFGMQILHALGKMVSDLGGLDSSLQTVEQV